ncbi:MAG: hypothetical protein KAW12_01835 [Candidatus Aminicenantes bacterium]|nr:hypothetical protein [Candidatus Aminicenantes bacterium]
MVITINEKEIEIFDGARVENGLLKYSEEECRAVQAGEKKVVDKNDNPVDLEGELSDGSVLFIKEL